MRKVLLASAMLAFTASAGMACEWGKMQTTEVPSEETVAMSTAPATPLPLPTVTTPDESEAEPIAIN